MTEKNRDDMQVQVLSKEKAKVLAEQYGWSPEFAEGYVDGEAWRRRRRTLPEHASRVKLADLGFEIIDRISLLTSCRGLCGPCAMGSEMR